MRILSGRTFIRRPLMRRGSTIILVLGLGTAAPASAPAAAEQVPSSVTVEHIGTIPIDGGVAQGGRLVGDRFFVTTGRNFSVYDVSNPRLPVLQSTIPLGYKCCNEDVATNGKILLFSETFPDQLLHVWDVSGPLPLKLAEVDIPRQHTVTCVLDCRWAYGSEGGIIDLRNPRRPELAGEWHVDRTPTHDFEEFKPGFLVNSPLSEPWSLELLDVRNPLRPRVVRRASVTPPGPNGLSWFHQAAWPRAGRDRFILLGAEGAPGPIMTFDTRRWKKAARLPLVDRAVMDESSDPDASSHWFDVHPEFRNGGLVAAAWNAHGARVLEVDERGQMQDLGGFRAPLASAQSAYWINTEIVYVIDLRRGIDIISVTRG